VPDGDEVPDRGLRGRRQLRGVAQAGIEGVEVVVLVLGAQVAVPANVEADLADVPPLGQRRGQVRRAVGHDGDTGPGRELVDAGMARHGAGA
jgi:hypothetical protein